MGAFGAWLGQHTSQSLKGSHLLTGKLINPLVHSRAFGKSFSFYCGAYSSFSGASGRSKCESVPYHQQSIYWLNPLIAWVTVKEVTWKAHSVAAQYPRVVHGDSAQSSSTLSPHANRPHEAVRCTGSDMMQLLLTTPSKRAIWCVHTYISP